MSVMDEIKEQIAYLKVWFGAFLVTLISLAGWLVSNYKTAEHFLIVFGVVGVLTCVVSVGLIHWIIQRLIRSLRAL